MGYVLAHPIATYTLAVVPVAYMHMRISASEQPQPKPDADQMPARAKGPKQTSGAASDDPVVQNLVGCIPCIHRARCHPGTNSSGERSGGRRHLLRLDAMRRAYA